MERGTRTLHLILPGFAKARELTTRRHRNHFSERDRICSPPVKTGAAGCCYEHVYVFGTVKGDPCTSRGHTTPLLRRDAWRRREAGRIRARRVRRRVRSDGSIAERHLLRNTLIPFGLHRTLWK